MTADRAALAQYRRTVAEHYAALRANPDPAAAARVFRAARDDLFREHPSSVLAAMPEAERTAFDGVPYAPYDAAWRFVVPLQPDANGPEYTVDLPEGLLCYRRFARAVFTAPGGEQGMLSLFWIEGYGGGVFLPFGDATNGDTSYGGGRYLYDTIKGADPGILPDSIVLDFNFAYHPSCYYSPQWTCPLTPPENRLSFAIPVGEQMRR